MRQPFERLLLGRTLGGRYALEEVIGAGGMSVVLRGMDRTLGRPVAVKVVALPADSEAVRVNLRERFRREAASAAHIPHHPNVVQVYDYGTDPELGLDFIVMELLRGRDLKEALAAEGPLPVDAGLKVLREAARGVAAGHRVGIVHRDVKPGNVFLAGDGGRIESVRVLDFGIAKPLRSEGEDVTALTTVGQLPHSPAYASPEQVDPDAEVGFASDVYQLGLVGYELLTGERAFSEAERNRIREGEEVPLTATPRWSRIPPQVRAVIARALERAPDDRYPDAVAFVEALSAAEKEAFAPPPPAAVPVPLPETDETRTIAAPAPAPPRRVAEPPRDRGVEPEEPRPVPLPGGVPVERKRERRSPLLWMVPLLLLGVLGIWALSRRGESGGDQARVAAPDTGEMARLEETFTELEGEVARRTGSAPVPAPGGQVAPVPGTMPGTAPGTATVPVPPAAGGAGQPPQQQDVLAVAATEIRAAVMDLNQAWVDGELRRHVSHYASRVNYYNSERLPRAGVYRDRRRDYRRYSEERKITIHNTQVQFLEPDRARVLADKEWLFRDEEGKVRQGRGTQEYIFKRDEDDGKWYVTSEQLLASSEARSPNGT